MSFNIPTPPFEKLGTYSSLVITLAIILSLLALLFGIAYSCWRKERESERTLRLMEQGNPRADAQAALQRGAAQFIAVYSLKRGEDKTTPLEVPGVDGATAEAARKQGCRIVEWTRNLFPGGENEKRYWRLYDYARTYNQALAEDVIRRPSTTP